ncbi:MAG: DUF5989 family protein [Nanoarchaeota archaeon]
MEGNRSFVKEMWFFIKERKVWWIAPIIVLLLIVGGLIILGQSSALSPFIYSLF